MPDDVKISEMSEAASLDNSAQFPYVQSVNGNLTTLKAPLSQIGTKINEGMTFSNLQTPSKNIVGAINDTKSYIDTKTTLVKSASGSLIHITDGGDKIPLKSCNITIDPDLTGHTEANLVVCGKNLLPSYNLSGSGTLTINSNNGVYSISGTASAYMNVIASDSFFLKSGTYTLNNIDNGNGNIKAQLRSVDGLTTYANSGTASDTFTLNETTEVKFRFTINAGTYNGTCKPELEIGNEANTFNQYNGTTYTTTFGTTVYGGSGNALTGEFVSEWGKYTITNDTVLDNYTTSAVYGSYARVSQIGIQKIDNTNIMAFCDVATGISFEQRTATANERRVYIEDTGYVVIRAAASDNVTSLEDLKNLFMGANICYALATPTSLTLSGVTPKTLLGINNIYNDCGDTDIDYFTSSADGLAALIEVLSNS